MPLQICLKSRESSPAFLFLKMGRLNTSIQLDAGGKEPED